MILCISIVHVPFNHINSFLFGLEVKLVEEFNNVKMVRNISLSTVLVATDY